MGQLGGTIQLGAAVVPVIRGTRIGHEPHRCGRPPISSTMNRNEGTPVDNEVVADAVGAEIQTRPASVEKPPAGVARGPTAMMRGYDRDGDGNFSRDEVRAMAVDFIKEKKSRRVATKAAIAMGLTLLLVVGLNAGLTAAIVFLSKDLKVTTDGLLTPDDKQVAQVAVAKQFIPLGLASYMTQSELLTINQASTEPHPLIL